MGQTSLHEATLVGTAILIPSSDEVSLSNWNRSFHNADAGKLIDDVPSKRNIGTASHIARILLGRKGPFTTTTTINPRSFSPREFPGIDSGSFIISREITSASGAMPHSRESSSRNNWYLAIR